MTITERHGGLFTSASEHWGTPQDVYSALDREFDFDLDPCPGLAVLSKYMTHLYALEYLTTRDWPPFRAAFVNPPYGRVLTQWIARTIEQVGIQQPATAVMLLPARTDTRWWHDLVMPNAREIRFLRGRIGFTGVPSKPERDRLKQRSRAPFPSVVVVL